MHFVFDFKALPQKQLRQILIKKINLSKIELPAWNLLEKLIAIESQSQLEEVIFGMVFASQINKSLACHLRGSSFGMPFALICHLRLSLN